VASLSQGRTAAAQCGLFTYKSVPVIFEPPCIMTLSHDENSHVFTFLLKTILHILHRYCQRQWNIDTREGRLWKLFFV